MNPPNPHTPGSISHVRWRIYCEQDEAPCDRDIQKLMWDKHAWHCTANSLRSFKSQCRRIYGATIAKQPRSPYTPRRKK